MKMCEIKKMINKKRKFEVVEINYLPWYGQSLR